MKTFVLAFAALLLVAAARPAAAQLAMSYGPPAYYGRSYVVPVNPYPFYGYSYPFYGYPLPPAPSFGFGRGGIYGHEFVPRDDSITSYTLPGREGWYR